jgi:hypothetical protein
MVESPFCSGNHPLLLKMEISGAGYGKDIHLVFTQGY